MPWVELLVDSTAVLHVFVHEDIADEAEGAPIVESRVMGRVEHLPLKHVA